MGEHLQKDSEEVLGRVALEARCEGCNYILCMQDVRRDGTTGLLVVRCPECGLTQPVDSLSCHNYSWLNRLHNENAGLASGIMFVLLAALLLRKVWYPEVLRLLNSRVQQVAVPQAIELVLIAVAAATILLAACGFLYRLNRFARLAFVAAAPAVAGLLAYHDTLTRAVAPSVSEGVLLASIPLMILTLGLAWWCRPLLRGLVRLLCPNASRYVFEGLWQVDKRLVTLGRW